MLHGGFQDASVADDDGGREGPVDYVEHECVISYNAWLAQPLAVLPIFNGNREHIRVPHCAIQAPIPHYTDI